MATKIVNPNRPFNPAQLDQLTKAFGEINVIDASANFPPSSVKDGFVNTAFSAAFGYPDIDQEPVWMPTGLSSAAAAVMAAMHGRYRSTFPATAVFSNPPDFAFLGTTDLNVIRNQARETRYADAESNPVASKTVVVNFSHNFTPEQRDQIVALLDGEVEFREGLSKQYAYASPADLEKSVEEQVMAVKLGSKDWESCAIVVNLPAHSAGAMIALAKMHGRMGHFPRELRVERIGEAFVYTEVIDLEALRLHALEARQNLNAQKTDEALTRLSKAFTGNIIHMRRDGEVVEFYTDDGTIATIRVSSAE